MKDKNTRLREKLFFGVFNQMLDYSDNAFIEKCAKWGLDTLETLEKNGRVLVAGGGERGNDFIYAITTAYIVGEFGKLSFNDHFSEETEIELDGLGLEFEDVEAYLDDDVPSERREELRKGNYVRLEDIWSTVQEWKEETYRALASIYTEKGVKEPILAIYASLVEVFEEKDEETGEIVAPSTSPSQELAGYSYVSEGFHY